MPDKPKPAFYGRRKGRALRKGRLRLLDELLPGLRIDASAGRVDPAMLFGPDMREIWLEIGFGGGEHLAEQARRHPDIGMIGSEPFINGVARLLSEIDRDGLANIRIHADDVRDLLDALPDASIARVFVLFPDPWPKARHQRRRFIGPENLPTLARVMRDGAELRLASDHMPLIRWMLFHTLAAGTFEWTARGPEDWRHRPGDWPATRYESKALSRGERCVYLAFRRRPRVVETMH